MKTILTLAIAAILSACVTPEATGPSTSPAAVKGDGRPRPNHN